MCTKARTAVSWKVKRKKQRKLSVDWRDDPRSAEPVKGSDHASSHPNKSRKASFEVIAFRRRISKSSVHSDGGNMFIAFRSDF